MVDRVRKVNMGHNVKNLLGHIKDHNIVYKSNVQPLEGFKAEMFFNIIKFFKKEFPGFSA